MEAARGVGAASFDGCGDSGRDVRELQERRPARGDGLDYVLGGSVRVKEWLDGAICEADGYESLVQGESQRCNFVLF